MIQLSSLQHSAHVSLGNRADRYGCDDTECFVVDNNCVVVTGDCHLANGAIIQETGRTPIHPLQFLARAYGLPEG